MAVGDIGTAVVVGSAGSARALPAVRVDGECLQRTLDRLRRGHTGKPMAADALARLSEQAVDLLGEIIRAYATDVAADEVGATGSAKAAPTPPLAGACPTGLLYGRVQSGKTAAMIVASALALDNGFRVIIVLTSNYEKLVEQTAKRFRALDGPLIYANTEGTGASYAWDDDAGNIRRHVAEHGILVICAKQADHQRALLQSLKDLGAPDYPALILDDEADQATPDTTNNARTQQKASAPAQGSTTYRLTIENDAASETGESFREVLRHTVYLQVTATPYALLLQNSDSPLRPKFTNLLEPGVGYTGGERFFVDISKPFAPPLVLVDEAETRLLAARAQVAPKGLASAIAFFLLSSAAHSMRASPDPEGYKFLCHTSPKNVDHDHLSALIRDSVDHFFEGPDSPALIATAYAELTKSLPDAPPLADLERLVRRTLHQRKVLTVNANGSALEFGSSTNFMVGGNILGRGLTIDNLLVTYYLRSAKTTQMDTMLQHARMYGYRDKLMPYTRVFLPETLAVRFHRIHESDTAIRGQLANPDSRARIVVGVAGTLRPTRPGVLDIGSIAAYVPGQQVYPTEPCYTSDDLGNSTQRITSIVERACGGSIIIKDFVDVALDDIIEVIQSVRTHDQEAGDWDPEAIVRVLGAIGKKYGNRGMLYVRDMDRTGPLLASGAISGGAKGEHGRARAQGKPVLFLMRESGDPARNWAGCPFWYPSLVFPSDMQHWMFNFTR